MYYKNFFTVITVFKNAENYLFETIKSVIDQKSQNKNIKLQYIIVDGESSDNSKKIVDSFNDSSIEYYKRKDKTMFDSLAFALKKVKGDFTSYLNAGDYYSNNCLKTVTDVFNQNERIKWITGLKFIYNESSQITDIKIPYFYRSRLIQCGVYGKFLPFIQQESTFWNSDLNNLIDYEKLKEFRNCGDLFIWNTFSKTTELYCVNSYLAGFKYHANQITFDKTGKIDVYLEETKKINRKINIIDIIFIIKDSFFWYVLNTFKNKIINNEKNYINFNSKKNLWE